MSEWSSLILASRFCRRGDSETGRLTREGVVSGTPDYMSPEQARSLSLSPATDIYAFGCILYEMLTSEPPFGGDAVFMLSRHMFAPPKPLRQVVRDRVPAVLDDLVIQMLAKAPEERPTAERVREVLRSVSVGAPARLSGRANDEGGVGRAARMISMANVPPPLPASPLSLAADAIVLGWMGEATEEMTTGLAANGIAVQRLESTQVSEALRAVMRVIFWPAATAEEIAALQSEGFAIICECEPGDSERLTSLLRGGASDVVMAPAKVQDLARKARRLGKSSS